MHNIELVFENAIILQRGCAKQANALIKMREINREKIDALRASIYAPCRHANLKRLNKVGFISKELSLNA